VLYNLAEGLRVTTVLLEPYLPEAAATLLGALEEPNLELAEFGSRAGGQRISKLAPLFPKVEAPA
jgi:methionyl-tRNA synthetase